ncbi:hypothetical protein GCM10027155_05240 [Acinetobacter apis]|uniref:Uncharacterized protein n=2 Tax=Acinetobacter apis TaxID=1229165 RepID=A0A217EEJ4_9GAMM|nr:hypothetical protein SAMN05444584_0530 [Acinetobacter apis]
MKEEVIDQMIERKGEGMKTVVKYIVLKSKEYQLGHPLHEEEIDANSDYFDQLPEQIEYQNLTFQVLSKELNRLKKTGDAEETQTIKVKLVALAD